MKKSIISITSFFTFGIGLLCHYLGHLISVIGEKGIFNKVLSVVGLFIIIMNLTFRKYYTPFKNKNLLIVFYLYLIWSLFIVIRIDTLLLSSDTIDLLRLFLFDERFFLSYFTPVVVFFGIKYFKFKDVFYVCIMYSVVNVILFLFYVNVIFDYSLSMYSSWIAEYIGLLFLPVSITLFSFRFISRKYIIIPFFSLLISLFSSIFLGRRSVTFIGLLSASFFIYMIFRNSKNKLMLSIMVVIMLFSSYNYYNGTIEVKSNGLLKERMDIDNRSPEDRDSMNSLTSVEFFTGKGLTGSYFSREHGFTRGMVESGIQHMILKGGLIYLILHYIILVYSFLLGFFKSNNDLIKGASLFILLKILILYPIGSPLFDFQEVILWICILYCNSIKFRKMNNYEVSCLIKYS